MYCYILIISCMKDRLMKIITSEGLTSSLLADEMGVQRSGISHILSGRNYPSFDFLQKLLNRFPKLNAEWLILGQGSMYKATETELPELFATVQKAPASPILPKKPETMDLTGESPNQRNQSFNAVNPESLSSVEDDKTKYTGIQPEISSPAKSQKSIEKIIILYTDKTFASYFPE